MTPGGVRAILRRLMQTRFLLATALGLSLALGAAGCGSACEDLGNRVCQCETAGQLRTNCQSNVKARIRASAPSGNEQSYCSSLLGSCPDPNGDVNQCSWMLNTCDGKVACGLALPTPNGCANVEPPPAPQSLPAPL